MTEIENELTSKFLKLKLNLKNCHYSILFINCSRQSSKDCTLTAGNLIDAIITHQINRTAVDPPLSIPRAGSLSGEIHRTNFVSLKKKRKI